MINVHVSSKLIIHLNLAKCSTQPSLQSIEGRYFVSDWLGRAQSGCLRKCSQDFRYSKKLLQPALSSF